MESTARGFFRCARTAPRVIRHETVTLVLVLHHLRRLHSPRLSESGPLTRQERHIKLKRGLVPLSMTLRTWFPCAIAACLTLSMLSASAVAQTGDTHQRQLARTNTALTPEINDEPVVLSVASPEDIKAASLGTPTIGAAKFQQLMLAAIDQRLGARYRWGGTGPSGFDCSGFVWSTFQSIGINFERGSARTLWSRFAVATLEEETKFGTLVFFSNLRHIGIVADENGFYHASRHHGVVYSPFNEYWLSRIDGFRRVPLAETTAAD